MATANTAIKITSLPNIGNNIAPSTLIPVVNMAGAPVTQKANLQITGNLILAGAGTANFVPAGLANLAYSVVNAAQPNITSTGTLNVNTLKVSGGVNGQYIQTDGTGNLAWVSGGGSGNGEVGGSDTQIQYNNAGNFGGNPGLTWDASNNQLNTVNFAASSATIYGNVNAINVNASGNIIPNAIYTDHYYYANGYVFGGGGNGTPGGANTQVQFNNNGAFGGQGNFTYDAGNNILNVIRANVSYLTAYTSIDGGNSVVANYFIGSGANLTNIAGANVSGFVPNANIANTAFAVAAANVIGLGNIATLSLSGSSSNVLYGNGVFAPASGGGNANTGNVTFNDINIIGTGNLNLQPDPANVSSYLDIFISSGPDIHIVASQSANLILGKDNQSNVMTSWDGNVYIQSWDTGTDDVGGVWTFGGDGNLTLPNTANVSINYADGNSYLGKFKIYNGDLALLTTDGLYDINISPGGEDYSYIVIPNANNAALGNPLRIGATEPNSAVQIETAGGNWTFNNNGDINIPPNATSTTSGRIQSANGYPTLMGYGSDSHGGPELNWMDGDDPNNMQVSSVLRNTLYLNGDDGLYVGMNENNVANTFTGSWRFTPQGTTIFPTLEVDLHNGGVQPGQVLQFGGPSGQQVIITGPTPSANNAADRLIIQGQRGNGTGEGGDVYVWAGDADINGGDIKIYAGDADNVSTGAGGYVNIDGGAGFVAGGDIELTGGTSANGTGGFVNTAGGYGHTDGGAVNIQGGHGQIGTGGAVGIYGGSGPVQGSYGNVEIGSGIYGWSFNNTGNLVLPGNTFAVNYANGTQVSIGGGANTGNVTFDDNIVIGTGDEFGIAGLFLAPGPDGVANQQYLQVRGGDYPTHIHLDTGNNAYYDQYFGADSKYVKLEANGNVVINADDGAGNGATWTFDTGGILTFPRDVAGNTDPYLSIEGGAIPKIQSTDVSLGGPANLAISADYLNLSGFSGDKIVFYADDGLIATDYDMVLTTNVGGGNIYTWTLDATGNLNLPGNLVIAGNTSVFGIDAALIQQTDGLPIVISSSGANGAVATYWVEDVGNVGTSNIAAVYVRPTLGANIVRIAVGQNGGNTGPNLWDFGTDGNLTLPTNGGHIIVSGGIVGGGASPAPYISGFDSIGALEFTNGNSNVTVTANATSWTFGTNGNLTLPEGGIVTNNIPPVTFDILYQYDDLEWDGITVTFTNASSTYMLGVLALMQAGDPITLVGPGGAISTTVAIPYTGGSAGYFTVTEANSPIQITQFTLPNRLTSVNGVTLTTNARNYLFTEAGVTQSPVLTVDTLPSGQYAVAGFRAFVSDANLAPVGNFGEIVGNSGSNTVCVWCDGTNWRIG